MHVTQSQNDTDKYLKNYKNVTTTPPTSN